MHLNLNTRTLNVQKQEIFFFDHSLDMSFPVNTIVVLLLFVSKFEETILFLDR